MHAIARARGAVVGLGLAALLFGGAGCKKRVETSGEPELTTTIYGVVRGGKGSGVVGGPIDNVQITAKVGDRLVGPTLTDASGSFTLDVFDLFPSGTEKTPEGLKKAQKITVDLQLEKPGFKTQTEVVTFPVPRYEEFSFYLSGQGE